MQNWADSRQLSEGFGLSQDADPQLRGTSIPKSKMIICPFHSACRDGGGQKQRSGKKDVFFKKKLSKVLSNTSPSKETGLEYPLHLDLKIFCAVYQASSELWGAGLSLKS